MQKENRKKLKNFCLQEGPSLFGVADISKIKDGFSLSAGQIKGLDRAISIGFRYSPRVLDGIIDRPTKLYYHHYRQINFFLDQLALRLVDLIYKAGHQALAIPASQLLDWEKQTGHLSHKEVAILAGIGCLGRNNLVVNEKFGAQFRLATILTDMPLEADRPEKGNCRDCGACMKACPAGAIKEKREDFDHIACYEKLREFRKLGYTDQFICGICVKACSASPITAR